MKISKRIVILGGAGAASGVLAATVALLLGVLELNQDVSQVELLLCAALFVVILLAFGMVAMLINSPFVNSAQKVTETARALAQGDYDVRVTGPVVREFITLVSDLHRIGDVLEAHANSSSRLVGRFEKDSNAAVSAMSLVQDVSRSQAERALKLGENMNRVSEDLSELLRVSDTLSRSAHGSVSEVTQVDGALSRITQLVESLVETLQGTIAKSREGYQGTRTVAADVQELSARVRVAKGEMGHVITISKDASFSAESTSETLDRLQKETAGIGEAIEAVVGGTNAIHSANVKILQVTESLEARVDQVDGVIEVIRNLAERTKLLSINASIIASEAGEHGKAFAVVANEVKDLAQSTGGAISEISQIVSGLKDGFSQTVETIQHGQDDVDKGVGLAREAVVVLRTIPEEVRVAALAAGELVRITGQQTAKFKTVESIVDQAESQLANINSVYQKHGSLTGEANSALASLGGTAEQISAMARQPATLVASLGRSVERFSAELGMLTDRLRERATGVSEVVRLAEENLEASKKNKRHSEEVVHLLGDLKEVAMRAKYDA